MAGHIISLSIFTILLAFFIVLNANANFDYSRAGPVLNSLERTFAAGFQGNNMPKVSPITSTDTSHKRGDAMTRLENVFRARIPGSTITRSSSRGTLTVQMPYDDIRRQIEDSILTDGTTDIESPNLLLTTIPLLNHEEPEKRIQMDIILNIQQNPGTLEPLNNETTDIEIAKHKNMYESISFFAKVFELGDLPTELINIGIQQGKADTVDIIFRPYKPYIHKATQK